MATQDLSLDIEEVWCNAIEAYRQDTGHDPIQGVLKTKIASVDDLGQFIEDQQTNFKEFRSKNEKVYRRIQRCLYPISALAGSASNMANSTAYGLPITITLGAVSHLIKASRDVSSAYDWVETVFAELDDFVQRLAILLEAPADLPMKRKIAYVMTFIIRIIGRSEYLIQKKRFMQFLKSTFLGADDTTKELIDKLNRAIKNAEGLAITVTYAKTHEIASLLSASNDQMRQMQSERLDQDSYAKAERVFHTKAFEATQDQYSRNKRTILKGTGSWLREEQLFETWAQQKAPILWVLGGPGSGKTMLSTWLVDYLTENMSTDLKSITTNTQDIRVAYFFLKQDDKELRTVSNLLKTLAWQLQESEIGFKHHLASVCQSSHKTAGPEQIWQNCFLDYFKSSQAANGRVILMVDGLDEMENDDRKILLTILNEFRHDPINSRKVLQFAILGRETLRDDLQRVGLENDRHVINVSSEKNRRDLEKYIKSRVQKMDVIKKMKRHGEIDGATKLSKDLQKEVSNGAEGVFLWARLLLDRIEGSDEPTIRYVLKNPPPTLDDMIYSELERFCVDRNFDTESMATIMLWISGSRRPLHFGELEFILRLDNCGILWLLWDQLRNKFASVLSLVYPRNYNPDNEQSGDTPAGESEHSTASEAKADGLRNELNDESDDESDDTDSGTDTTNDDEDDQTLGAGPAGTYKERKLVEEYYSMEKMFTIVGFLHLRFRDLVQAQGNYQQRGKDILPIFNKIRQTDYHLFVQSVQMMQIAFDEDTIHKQLYLDYPTNNIWDHLDRISYKDLDDEQRTTIWEGLDWLLRKPQGGLAMFLGLDFCGPKCDDFWQMWYVDRNAIAVIQRWFLTIPPDATGPMFEWMRQASTSSQVLLQPLALAAAKIWLQKQGYGDPGYLDKSEFRVSFLYAYLSMSAEDTVSDECLAFLPSTDIMPKISATSLENMAEWAELEKDTHWYSGLGWILWQLGHHDEALNTCQKAIDLDSGAWVAMEAKASILASRGNYKEAIEQMKEAIDVIPPRLAFLASYLEGHASRWAREQGELELSRQMAQHAWYENPEAWPAIDNYLSFLQNPESSEELISVLQVMDATVLSHTTSKLVSFFNAGVPSFIRQACRRSNKPNFVIEAAKNAMTNILNANYEPHSIWFMFELAQLHYEYDMDQDFVKLYTTAMKRFESADPTVRSGMRQPQSYHERFGVEKYAQVCYDVAVAHRKDGQGANKAAKRLLDMASITGTTSIEDNEEAFVFFSPDYSALLWGRWQREHVGEDDKVWQKSFRSRILRLLEELDDDDPTNDQSACQSLAVTLFQAGDRQSAAEILAILFKPLDQILAKEVSKTDIQHLDRVSDGPNGGTDGSDSSSNNTDLHDEGKDVLSTMNPPVASEIRSSSSSEHKQEDSNIPQVDPQEAWVSTLTPLLRRTTIDSVNVDQDTASNDQRLRLSLGYSWGYTCDVCSRDAKAAESMWFCEICFDTNFCSDCLIQVKKESLAERWCNPLHTWYQAWPIPEDRFADLAIKEEEGLVVLERAWLEKLRRKWLIDAIVAEP